MAEPNPSSKPATPASKRSSPPDAKPKPKPKSAAKSAAKPKPKSSATAKPNVGTAPTVKPGAADPAGSGLQPARAKGSGDWLAWFCAGATGVFAVLTLAGMFTPAVRWAVIWVDTLLFALGVVGFPIAIALSGYRALDGVGVRPSGIFLAGFATRKVQLLFRWSLGVTIVLGVAGALLAPGPPYVLAFPAMAFGILVPIFPPAIAGIHGAWWCPWPKRPPRPAAGSKKPASSAEARKAAADRAAARREAARTAALEKSAARKARKADKAGAATPSADPAADPDESSASASEDA